MVPDEMSGHIRGTLLHETARPPSLNSETDRGKDDMRSERDISTEGVITKIILSEAEAETLQRLLGRLYDELEGERENGLTIDQEDNRISFIASLMSELEP